MASEKKQPGAFKSFVAGGAGGVCIVLTGHPLDTIKVNVLFKDRGCSNKCKSGLC